MFPDELMDSYRLAMVKFKKTQKALFKYVEEIRIRTFGSELLTIIFLFQEIWPEFIGAVRGAGPGVGSPVLQHGSA